MKKSIKSKISQKNVWIVYNSLCVCVCVFVCEYVCVCVHVFV